MTLRLFLSLNLSVINWTTCLKRADLLQLSHSRWTLSTDGRIEHATRHRTISLPAWAFVCVCVRCVHLAWSVRWDYHLLIAQRTSGVWMPRNPLHPFSTVILKNCTFQPEVPFVWMSTRKSGHAPKREKAATIACKISFWMRLGSFADILTASH